MFGLSKRIVRGDTALSLAFAIFGMVIFINSFGIKLNAGEHGQVIDSAYFPKLLAFFMISFSLINLVTSLAKHEAGTAPDPAVKKDPGRRTAALRERPSFGVLVTVGLAFGYFLLFDLLPFLLSSFLFMGSFLFIFRRGKPVSNIAIALLFSFAVYSLFTFAFEVMLPSGIFDFSNLTGN